MKLSLKSARVNAGYTQTDVAKLLGKHPSTILNWEKGGGKNINWYDFQRLCELYKVDPNVIFFKK